MLRHTIRSAALTAALATGAAAQTTWYVDDDAPPPGDGTESSPFPTLNAAVAVAGSGDVVLVAPGSYTSGSITISNILVRATEGPEETTLSGGQVVLSGNTAQTVLEGFTVAGSLGSWGALNLDYGTVRGCVIRDNPGTGLFITSDGIVEHTTIVGNGVGLSGWHGYYWGTIRNTILWGNQDNVDEVGCVDWLNCAGYAATFCNPPVDHIPGDPGFWSLANGDLHLRPGSPCVGTGAYGAEDRGALPYEPTYAPVPQRYCEGAPNSVGVGANLGWTGTPNLGTNDLHLRVGGAVPGQFGLFFYGPWSTQVPFGDGLRCVAPGLLGTFRLMPVVLIDGAGFAQRHVDLDAPPADAGPGQVELGSIWHFQFWYRDPAGPLGSGFNLSDALEVGFGL